MAWCAASVPLPREPRQRRPAGRALRNGGGRAGAPCWMFFSALSYLGIGGDDREIDQREVVEDAPGPEQARGAALEGVATA